MLHVGRLATVLLVILLARVASTDVSKGAIYFDAPPRRDALTEEMFEFRMIETLVS